MEDKQKHIAVWDDCLKIICEIVGQQQYTTWFKPIRPVSLEDAVLTLEVPSNWFMEYIESAYLDVLRKTLHRVIGENARLIYKIRPVRGQQSMNIPGQQVSTPVNPDVTIAAHPSDKPNPFVYPGIHRIKIDPRLNPV